MPVPIVTIVGRPNVGKSSLFNWLAGKRIAIVDPTAGVTRDRVSSIVLAGDRHIELIDTGGVGIKDHAGLTEDVERQIRLAIEQAAVVLFVVDARDGLVPLDEEVARRLREVNKPIVCVANKCDTVELDPQASDFFQLGYGTPINVSAQQGRGRSALLETLAELLPAPDDEDSPQDAALKLAIVGRRNTGKSTFINWLSKSERMIVSEVAGTTRDSVDVRFQRDGKVYVAIDTAGVRKKKSVASDIEFYSMARAERSIRRADVVLHFFEPQPRISRVDKQLADYVLTHHKPAIFVINKWDQAKDRVKTGPYADYVHAIFPMLDFVPVGFISAKTGHNVGAVMKLAEELHEQAKARVGTGDLNRVLRWAIDKRYPPLRQNRRPKIYYATQVSCEPPTIVLFTNGPELFSNTYQKYLLKTFRDQLPYGEIPIKLTLRKRQRDEGTGELEVPAEEGTPKPKKAGEEVQSRLWDDV